MPAVHGRRGQALLETLLAAVVLTFAFMALFRLSHMLTGKILAEHAAMRVARARTVGLNNFMCVKAARIATISVAGRRLWPLGGEFDYDIERARSHIYMATPTPSIARGVLEYEGWGKLGVMPGDGTRSEVSIENEWFSLEGSASLEHNYDLYMHNAGL